MRRIATEEAFATPEQMQAMARIIDAGARDADSPFWSMMNKGVSPFAQRVMRQLLDLEHERVAIMNAHGVDMHVLALTSPGVQTLPRDEAVGLAQRSNDLLAQLVRRRPDRFAGLATIAPQEPEAAAREIERAMCDLGLNGVMINSHTNDEYLDEAKFLPIFEAAAATGAPIYLHPRAPSGGMAGPYFKYGLETAIWGYGAETGLHALRLLVSGLFDRFPKLQLVLGHMGEGLPFWLWRIEHMYTHGSGRPKLERGIGDYLRENVTITTSGMNSPPGAALLHRGAGRRSHHVGDRLSLPGDARCGCVHGSGRDRRGRSRAHLWRECRGAVSYRAHAFRLNRRREVTEDQPSVGASCEAGPGLRGP